ncbi:ABC transporter C family member 3-like [Macadamia integrifolia]|uniref:ABC transporter C family member 3-like n=1 Tax=Macadamia integrifolia TaxID=60698 RepID=UPI001C5284F1|nr:ABC transporter C family member 3-like [Macadamia integrifolia]
MKELLIQQSLTKTLLKKSKKPVKITDEDWEEMEKKAINAIRLNIFEDALQYVMGFSLLPLIDLQVVINGLKRFIAGPTTSKGDIETPILVFVFMEDTSKGREDRDFQLLEPLLKISSNQNNGNNGQGSSISEGSVSSYANANLFNIFTFSWMNPLLAQGYNKTLDLEDVPQLANCDSANVVFTQFRNKLESYCNGNGSGSQVSTIKLVKALIISTLKEILWTAIFCIACTLASYVGPYLIHTFVQFLNSPYQLKYKGYVLVLIFFLSKLIRCLSERHLFFQLRKMSIRVRAALVGIIYKKGLMLSSQSKQNHTSGEATNLISVDVERISFFSWYLHNIWKVPVQIVLALLILYKYLGLASLVAFVATIILMLANFPLGKLQEKFQGELMDSKDRRMNVTSEALRNIKILKLQGWEIKFLAKIIELRNFETRWLKKLLYTSALTSFVYLSAPMFVSLITFGFCVLTGIPLDSGKILSALATFDLLQTPIYNVPSTISMVVQTKVSLDRIASFLCLDDLHLNIVQKLPRNDDKVAVEIVEGNFSWNIQSSDLTLKDLNFQVHCGMRVAICGSVGSGKSSLLSCILGEVPKVSGAIKLNGTKAYVAQSPWIQSGKIVDNILFGNEMDKERYEMILEACSLKKDLEVLAFGDQTIIGERGINLSGGQKQRIQIARALYYDADIYLLDDPFSAVDAHTGAHLFKECLLGILGSKTVIYVTHQIEFLPSADLILVMKDGRITQTGNSKEIFSSGIDFIEAVDEHKKALADLDSVKCEISMDNLINGGEDGNIICSDKSIQEDEERELKNKKTENFVVPEEQLVQEEKREKGGVNFSVYWKYVTAAYKGAFVPLILLAQILYGLLLTCSSYWVVLATPISEDVTPYIRGSTLIFVYVALAIGCSLCVFIRSMLIVTVGYKTATLFFNKMHLCIFHAPLLFFDSTPSGRILNRASIDQSVIDTSISHQFEELLVSVIEFLGTAAVMSQVAWQMFIVFIPMTVLCIWYQQYYVSTAQELSRLTGVCQAPIIQHFSESSLGSTTIRCFDQGDRFLDTSLKLVDGYSRPKFHFSGAMEWLCFCMDMLASITYVVSLVSLISVPKGILNPGVVGLAITYGLGFSMHGIIWDLSILQNKIISVERILQYVCIPSEPPLLVEENRPNCEWPSQGKVDILDLQIRYGPHLPLVLRGLTCTFPGGMKIGIVGRTGSGKSTLAQALFRLFEPTSGQIWIDGINISKIGLHDLRSRLSIIPQEPTMFEGTLRSNLDPLEEYTNEQIWEALDKCQLGDEFRKKEGKLDSTVTENGENWSMGQRQLVCLARVLLKKSKVLVLDEATASVDTMTDYLIRQTIRQQFSGSTVITIAHRLTSILDVDMVLLLDNGLLVEYDSPSKLLKIESSSFAKLVKEYTLRWRAQVSILELAQWWKRNNKIVSCKEAWTMGFGIVIDHLWRERNNRVYEGVERITKYTSLMVIEEIRRNAPIAKGVNSLVDLECCKRLGLSIQKDNRRHILEVYWCKPPINWIKLNFDGSSLGNPGHAGAGGIFRDHLGKVICSYKKYMGVTGVLEAEVEGLMEGLMRAKDMDIQHLWIESDSRAVVVLIQQRKIPWFALQRWIYLQPYMRRISWKISHNYREGNSVADFLARDAAKSGTRRMLSNSQVLTALETNYQGITKETWEEEFINGRVDLEKMDYSGKGPNIRKEAEERMVPVRDSTKGWPPDCGKQPLIIEYLRPRTAPVEIGVGEGQPKEINGGHKERISDDPSNHRPAEKRSYSTVVGKAIPNVGQLPEPIHAGLLTKIIIPQDAYEERLLRFRFTLIGRVIF